MLRTLKLCVGVPVISACNFVNATQPIIMMLNFFWATGLLQILQYPIDNGYTTWLTYINPYLCHAIIANVLHRSFKRSNGYNQRQSTKGQPLYLSWKERSNTSTCQHVFISSLTQMPNNTAKAFRFTLLLFSGYGILFDWVSVRMNKSHKIP